MIPTADISIKIFTHQRYWLGLQPEQIEETIPRILEVIDARLSDLTLGSVPLLPQVKIHLLCLEDDMDECWGIPYAFQGGAPLEIIFDFDPGEFLPDRSLTDSEMETWREDEEAIIPRIHEDVAKLIKSVPPRV